MKKIFKRAISILTITAILATSLVTSLASTVFAEETETVVEPIIEEWLYDFKSGTGTDSAFPAYMVSHPTKGSNGDDLNQWATYSSDRPSNGKTNYFDADGFHYFSYYSNGAYNLGTNGDSWVRGFLLWDADVARQNQGARDYSDGNFGDGSKRNTFPDTAEDGNLYVTYGFWGDPTNSAGLIPVQDGLYAVTVKFKVSEMNTATSRIDLGVSVANYAWSGNNDWKLQTTNYLYDKVIIKDVMDDWATLTTFVDGSVCKGEGKNYLKIGITNDKFTNDGTYNQIDIESVKVKRLYDAVNDETGVRYVYPTSMTKNSAYQGIDYPGLEPVLVSANQGVVLPTPAVNSATREFYRWLPYDVSENIYLYYSQISGYFDNTRYADQAYNWLTTYAGSTFKPGKGAFGLGADVRDTVAAGETITSYSFDIDGFLNNKDELWKAGSAFMSTGIYNTASKAEDGGLVISDATGGSDAWFYDSLPGDNGGYHRLGFYSGLGENGGTWGENAVKFKNGYTYKVEMTYKVDLSDASEHKSVDIGMGYPVIVNNYTTWANTHASNSWRTLTGTNGYVTVYATIDGTLFNDNHYLCINISCNGNKVTIKELKVTETFVGNFNVHGMETAVEGTNFIEQNTQSVINGYVNDGNWYADAECTIPATEFNSKVRTVYAGGTKKFDVSGTANGALIVDNTEDGVIVTVEPEAGYKLAAGGISATVGEKKTRVIFDVSAANNVFVVSGAATPDDISAMEVTFVKENVISLDIIAASIRRPSGEGEEYQSAGLRFRGRVTDSDKLISAGFVIIPTALVNGDITVNTTNAIVCETGIDEIVYYYGADYRDFQVKLTGLSSVDGSKNLTDTAMTCVMFVRLDDGSIVYSDASSVAYSDIAG